MKAIPITSIIVPPDRQRESFDERAISDLAESIRDKGLFHPLVVRNDGVTLVAGERRLRAILHLFHTSTPAISCNGEVLPERHVAVLRLGDLTPYQVREAELEENIRRMDLTWQERSRALAELHTLRSEQAADVGGVQTIRDTAREILGVLETDVLGDSAGEAKVRSDVSTALKLHDYLDDPEVARAKSEREALKIVERKAREAHRQKLLAQLGTEGVRSPHILIEGDTLAILPGLDRPAAFNGIITDPPYGVGADSFGDQAGASHEYTDDIQFAMKCYSTLFLEASRLCKPTAYLMTFCDIRVFPVLFDLAEQLMPTWTIWQTPLIWSKGNGMLPVPDKGPRRTYEAILYAYRGNVRWQTSGSPDIIDVPALGRPEFGAQKPPDLYSNLLSRVALPGDHILDPFAGACPLIPAATAAHCIATCIEMNPKKIAFARTEYGV